MGMGFALTWLRQVTPMLHMTTLTTVLYGCPDTLQFCPGTISGCYHGQPRTSIEDVSVFSVFSALEARYNYTFYLLTCNMHQ